MCRTKVIIPSRLSAIQLGSKLGSAWFRLGEIHASIYRMTQFLHPTCLICGAWFRLGSTWFRRGHASRHVAQVAIPSKLSAIQLGSWLGSAWFRLVPTLAATISSGKLAICFSVKDYCRCLGLHWPMVGYGTPLHRKIVSACTQPGAQNECQAPLEPV